MSHEEYIASIHGNQLLPYHMDITPTAYLVVPFQEPALIDEVHGRACQPAIMGVVVLYQLTKALGTGFHPRQRAEACQYAERIALTCKTKVCSAPSAAPANICSAYRPSAQRSLPV